MVSSLFYPHDPNGEAKKNYKALIESSFRSICPHDVIQEE